MALTTVKNNVLATALQTLINFNDRAYRPTYFGVLNNLCSEIILGQDFQKKHKSVTIKFVGTKLELVVPDLMLVCALAKASLGKPSLFAYLLPGCKPIATKSRHFSKGDHEFIHQEMTQVLTEGIIEPSTAPWRAQVVVVKDPLL